VEAATAGLLRSAHDCSHGGLAVTLTEACLQNHIGFSTEGVSLRGRRDAVLFGETPSRAVVATGEGSVADLEAMLHREGVPYTRIGRTGGQRLVLATHVDAALDDLGRAYESGLGLALEEKSEKRARLMTYLVVRLFCYRIEPDALECGQIKVA
jgi:phosphoribosylformylglycinamidine synthase